MSRRRTKSDAVSFRLPIDLWEPFRAQADSDGLTPAQYSETVVRRHVQQRDSRR